MLDELLDLLARVSALLTPEDLMDLEIAGLVSQLCGVLDPNPEPLPKAMVVYLSGIENEVQRFREAALKTGVTSPQQLSALAASLKQVGLIKND